MIINFQYNYLRFAFGVGDVAREGEKELQFQSYGQCFEHLVNEEGTFFVRVPGGGLRELCQFVHAHYKFVKAAGGIVDNGAGSLLLMERNGRADLPKGKVEVDETLAEAALRETNEETGLRHLALGPLLLKTYHIYDLYGRWHFKQTSWFAMRADGAEPLVPQTEEGITQCRWTKSSQWQKALAGSYATMRVIVNYLHDTQWLASGC